MKQQTFSDMEYSNRRKKTKRDEFLEIMNEIIPWDEWVDLIKPHYFDGRRGRPPIGIEKMLRMYLLQIWFINADDVLGETGTLLSHNTYAYCGNNPVIREDPDGDIFNLIATAVGFVVGGAIGFVSNGLANLAEGKSFTENCETG